MTIVGPNPASQTATILAMNAAASTDPYARIDEFYDVEHDSFDDDVDFYLNSIEAVGDPVLELGCGTGRLLGPIAAAGFRVTGIDQSPAMLARARDRLESKYPRVSLRLGTMQHLEGIPDGTFGVVLLSLNGLHHLASANAQRRALASIRRVLDPRGQLLIDAMNPTVDTLRSFDGSVIHEGRWTLPPDTFVDKFSARRLAQADQLIRTRIWYDVVTGDGNLSRIDTEFDLRYVYCHELELMLEFAGFSDWNIYGSYELDPFDDSSDRLIVAAEATSVGD